MIPSWSDVHDSMSSAWTGLRERASSAYDAAIQADPGQFVPVVRDFLALLTESRSRLDRIQTQLSEVDDRELVAQAAALESRYTELAAGLYSESSPADEIGVAPLVIVGAIAVSAAGVAWAVAAYEYASNLRDHTALLEQELQARIDASRQGRVLPPSTLPPPPPDPVTTTTQAGGLAFGGVAAVGALLLLGAVPFVLSKLRD